MTLFLIKTKSMTCAGARATVLVSGYHSVPPVDIREAQQSHVNVLVMPEACLADPLFARNMIRIFCLQVKRFVPDSGEKV
jgi:hypothetical protein